LQIMQTIDRPRQRIAVKYAIAGLKSRRHFRTSGEQAVASLLQGSQTKRQRDTATTAPRR